MELAGAERRASRSDSAARTRVLDVAERLFTDRGYTAGTLRDIAGQLGIRQASLYHHAPGGKEQLYIEVTERALARHRLGMTAAIAGAEPALEDQLRAVARWLLSQPPLNLTRLIRSDIPALEPKYARALMLSVHKSLVHPLQVAFETSREQSSIRWCDSTLMADSFIAIIEGIHVSSRFSSMPPEQMAEQMIDVLLNGLRPR